MGMMENFFGSAENAENAERLEQGKAVEQLDQLLEQAVSEGDVETAKFYECQREQMKEEAQEAQTSGEELFAEQPDERLTPKARTEISFGSSERAEVEKKLKDAEANLEFHTKRYEQYIRYNTTHEMSAYAQSSIDSHMHGARQAEAEIKRLKSQLRNLKD